MQIEIKETEYEISAPKKNPVIRIFDQLQPWVEKNGGWKLIFGISIIAFVLAEYLLPKTNDMILMINGQWVRVDDTNTKWGSNFYYLIVSTNAYYRWVTANFLHFGFLHIAFNLLATYMIGTFLEKIWNAKIFLLLFIITGILANIGTFIISKGNSAGASGGVFGLMGGLLAFFLWSKDLDPGARLFMLKQIGVLVLINIFLGLVIPNIDLVGHLSGFAAGLLVGKFLTIVNLKKRPNLMLILWFLSIGVILFSFAKATIDYFKAISF